MGVVFAFVYLLLDLLFFCIFDFIQFCIDHKGQVSRGNCCTTFCDRVSILVYVMFIDVPLLVLFALGMQWTQEYLFIACFFAVGISRVLTLGLSPIVTPMFSTYEDLPDKYKELRGKILELASRVKYRGARIVVKESNTNDLHSNAATPSSHIEVSRSLLEQHKGHEDEILGVLGNEFGHWHL